MRALKTPELCATSWSKATSTKRTAAWGLAFPEMIPATRGERRAIQFDGRGATADGADSGERQTFEFGRDLNARRRGEEQFVVLAAIQGLAESGAGVDGRGGDFGFDARGAAEAMEIGRASCRERV